MSTGGGIPAAKEGLVFEEHKALDGRIMHTAAAVPATLFRPGRQSEMLCTQRRGKKIKPSDLVFFTKQDPQVSFHIRRSRIFDGLFSLFNLICPDLQNIVTS